ncbi:putative Ig domain-containing protein [Xanthomonas phaseoli]|uniref:putative Ig domain-containing protein n=1 Tax=Xanthomonas phaseoli TaxID=1985254 RepID=UPI0006E56C8C|nr:putative Ig domain-containing protein [Xanthomonas phaseoli]MBO9789362.1 autotransporter domain-containing protein [Xanthomonas phaseoli pv. dieffenbachiae]MBO9887719.1 autotransporter domain-containing protein [Xanthomonas phaseoli pv. dieffenbachiae]MBO9913497.1 autotransporter domain-containing protein [Xanthomonas phaseoli pv. dieffenbachiae]MBO9937021.1 autotransporter domain-containing protein [Xanthomonas phaseoli pv. dieffenbachiae]MBO9994089.1 autotransporter domain-containing prot
MALRWLMALLLLASSHTALAAYCPAPKSATVSSGGSVTFDVSDCDGPFNAGMADGAQPSHGSYSLTGQLDSAGTERVTYTNNGDGATSDSFYLLDEDNNQVVFNITINPSRTASIAVSPSAANEDSGTSLVYTVTLSQTNSSPTTVNLTRSGTATSGTDYTGAVSSVVVPANATSVSFSITPVADTTVEPDETAIFSVASGTDYSVGNPSSATATIVNDDFPVATITVSPASVYEDGAPNLVYTVALSQPSPSALSIGFNVGGTATNGTDYATINSPLVIAAGQTSGTITVNPTPDTTVEPDETVVISLNAGSGYTVGSPNSATGTILNDDLPGLSINDVSVNEGNAGTTNATFTVSLSAPAGAGGVSFDLATADGTATAGVDYAASSLTRTIPAGSSSATFTVLVNGDTLAEPDETFFVNVSNVTGATVSDGQGLGTIVNDDAQPALSIDDVSVNEGNSGTTTATFTVSLSAASGQTVTVNYATADGTATAGSDYVARSGTLSFAPGVTAQGVAVTVNGDTAVEPNETFSVGLSGASNATIARATGTGTILNDDAVVTISPTSLPAATAGTAYSQTLTASGGTPGYSFVISAGTLPAGMTLNAAGVLSGTPTASGSFNFTVTATDSGVPTSGSRAYTLTVAGANVTLPATTLPAGTAGQAYSSAITPATGGIAPYSYALIAGALPAGITLNSSSGTLTGTTTSVGSFNFSVTATDSTSGTPSQGTRGYTLNIAAPTIALAPATVPTATRGTAYSQTLTASGGTAAYTYAITSGALPAGITLASNGTLSGTATLEGTFNFTVQATDANSFTGTQAYSLTVAGPNLVLPASTLPAGTAGQAYAAAIAPATGGTAPYSYAVTAGALPGGVVLDAATGGLSGTPTVSGTFTFTLTVTDSTPSPAAQASRSYALTVNAATLVLRQPTLPAAVRGSAYSQVLTASGGIAPYRYSIASGTLPAGLTLASDGTLSGTPTVQGTSSFTIAVADAGNATATQAYTFTVNDAAPVAVADVAATMTDTAVTAAVTANDTGSITAIAIASAPTNGTAVVSGLEVVYTPNAGFTGTDVLSYTATGAGGTSAAVTLTITVNVRPVAVSVTAAAVPGEAQQVDITRNATGGPFVAAAVVAVLPASAGTATITRVGGTATAAAARTSGLSPAATAMAEAPSFTLTFTPNPAFVGQATVQFTLSNAFATSAPASVVFNIAPRRDPSVDAEVRGLIDAQSESTRRFARAQIDNFQRRLEATHRGGGSFTNAVSFQPTSHCRQAERGISAQPCSPDTQDADNDFRDAPAVASSTGSSAQTQGDLGLWVGGAIRSGSLNRQTNSNGVDFQTDGLSVGADYRVASSLAIGAGLGWGRDDSDVGNNGSHSKATAYTMALYASFHPGKAFFFDTLVGYQMLSYDLRRFVTDDSSLAEGNRDGKQWIASLSTGADLQRGTLQITPYARVDVARATLDGYAEQGVAPFALRYADMDVATTTGNLGLRLEWRREVAWGRLSPQLRVEYQRDFQGRGDAILSYADLTGGPFYRTAQSAFDRNRLMVGIGAALLTEQGLSTRLEYRGITDGDSNNDQTWMINLEKKY